MGKETEKSSLGIKSWAEEDRPREKMLAKGAEVLSNAELLAILIGSGNSTDSAVTLSQKILAYYDNDINLLARVTVRDLIASFKGIGKAKAVSIMAALELGRRRKGAEVRKERKVTCSSDLYDYFSTIADLSHEEFWAVFMNNSNKIISSKRISQGGIDRTVVDVRLLLKSALEGAASAMAVCHNHPSGSLVPSGQDVQITQKIKGACQLMDIRFLDHLIISVDGYYSFSDEGEI